jgi:anti-sigma regulatory factor (Ser/Thr protein kinase)
LSTPRRALHRALRDTGLPSGRAAEYLTAIGEVLANAVQHGRGPVQIRLLTDDDGWWCTVTDHGPGTDDPYAGIESPLPGNPGAGGAGLWLARQFADQVTLAGHPHGLTVTVALRG